MVQLLRCDVCVCVCPLSGWTGKTTNLFTPRPRDDLARAASLGSIHNMRRKSALLLLLPASAGCCTTPLTAMSLPRLAAAISQACIPLGEWPEPEDAAAACAEAISSGFALSESLSKEEPPPQGELFFGDVPNDERLSIAEPLAHAGDSQAMQSLGLLLFGGMGGAPCDARLSAQWHAAAVAKGNVDALATLGGCVRRGVGAEQSERQGLGLIEAAASAGSPVGLVKLGVLYDEGASGLAQDSWKACQLFEQAAATGSALGLFNHGFALFHGIGTAVRDQQSISFIPASRIPPPCIARAARGICPARLLLQHSSRGATAPVFCSACLVSRFGPRQRDVERGLALWAEAIARAPDDGAEEAAFCLYDERAALSEEQRARYRPGVCLKLAAELGFEPAVAELKRRRRNRAAKAVYSQSRRAEGAERFVRNDKARAWTQKEERGEAFLE